MSLGRRTLRWAHRWLGLAAGLVLVVTGLSGSALVFREEIDAALNPHLLRVAPRTERASLQAIDDLVRAGYPETPPTRIRMPRGPDGTYEFWMGATPDRYVYADPYSGAILGSRRPSEFLTGWLFLLHSQLLSGEMGHLVAGCMALALIALSLSGIVIWWPRRAPWVSAKQWRAALTVKRNAGAKRVTFDLHRAVGFYASALLLMAGVTGASLVFTAWFEKAAHVVAGTTPVKVVTGSAVDDDAPRAPALPLDTLLASAITAQPGGVISYLYLPTAPDQAFRVRQRLPGEKHPNGKSFVHVDPRSGRVIATEDGARAPRGARLYSILYPLHIGVLGGTLTRLIAILVGLSLPTLAITGILVWWRRDPGGAIHRRARG